MSFKKRANKALAFLLAFSLVMGGMAPVGVLAEESVSGNSVAVEKVAVTAETTEVLPTNAIEILDGGIDLNGNPVVVQQARDEEGNDIENKFSLIYDADRDGIVDDGETYLEVSGETAFDYTLNLYGDHGYYGPESIENSILITMESGTVNGVYGLYSSSLNTIPSDQEAVRICINGGNAKEVYGFYEEYDSGNTMTGRIYMYVGEQAYVPTCKVAYVSGDYNGNFEKNTPHYVDNQGDLMLGGSDYCLEAGDYDAVTFSGKNLKIASGVTITTFNFSGTKCTFSPTVSVGTINVKSGEVVISQGVSVSEVYLNNSGSTVCFASDTDLEILDSYYNTSVVVLPGVTVNTGTFQGSGVVYLKGHIVINASSFYGTVLAQGGTITGNASVYSSCYKYPLTITVGMEGQSVDFYESSDIVKVTENDVATYYFPNASQKSYTSQLYEIPGYDCYYSIDGGEYALATVSYGKYTFDFAVPEQAFSMDVQFVPSQISVTNKYSPVKGSVGVSYTDEKPLCDLSIYEITGDVSTEMGGEVKYAVKRGSSLPAGLSLVKGKIVGTPTVANETGHEVTFVVTGRNGSTADLSVIFKIAQGEVAKKDINTLYEEGVIKIEYNCLDLGGTSVVIAASDRSAYSTIYLDADHDGLPDDNKPLIYNGSDSIYLGSWSVCGYTNTQQAYEGDISITVDGGDVPSLYGIKGDDTVTKDKPNGAFAEVKGDVTINFKSGTMGVQRKNDIRHTTRLKGAYYGKAENIIVDISGGSFESTTLYGAQYSIISGDVNFSLGKNARINTPASTYSQCVTEICPVTGNATVEGNVNVNLGFAEDSAYGFQINGLSQSYTYYYGVNNATVKGDVNYVFDGTWKPGYDNTLVAGDSDITGNVKVSIGSFLTGSNMVIASGNGLKIGKDITLDAQENATISVSNLTVLTGTGAVNNLHIDIPTSCSGSTNINSYTTGVSGDIYINNRGKLILRGEYELEEDMSLTGLEVLGTSVVSIDESAKVDVSGSAFGIASGSTLTNKGDLKLYGNGTGIVGVLDNQGVLKTSNISVVANGLVINRKNANWTLEGAITNNGKIVNYGILSQTYTSTDESHLKLGVVYTTTPLLLSESIDAYTLMGLKKYSELFFAVTIEYPTHCLTGVTLDSADLSNSGINGDSTQYIKLDQYYSDTFTVTPGELKRDDVVLESVTYGPNQTKATEQDGVWSGTIASRTCTPITITLNYIATNEVPNITLDDEDGKDTVSDLTVGNIYTEESPLYDLTAIGII